MRFDAETRTRISAKMVVAFDPTGSTVEVKVGSTWHPATWQGTPVVAGDTWTQTARTTGYFAGPSHATPAGATVLTIGRHLTQTRVTSGGDTIVSGSTPIEVA